MGLKPYFVPLKSKKEKSENPWIYKDSWTISYMAEKKGFEPSRRLPDLHP